MPYAIEARFDPELEQALSAVWTGLEAVNVPTPRSQGFLPHLTLGLFDDAVERELEPRLAGFAATTALVPMKLDALGVFVSPGSAPGQDAILYLAPVVTEGLLAVHRRLHEAVLTERVTGVDPRYVPDRWVPHCTLTERMPFLSIPVALGHLLGRFRPPLVGHLVAVELVRFDPTEHRFGFALGGAGSGSG